MRFSQSQYENYLARRSNAAPAEALQDCTPEILSIALSTHPIRLVIDEKHMGLIRSKIAEAGALVTGVAACERGSKIILTICWPDYATTH